MLAHADGGAASVGILHACNMNSIREPDPEMPTTEIHTYVHNFRSTNGGEEIQNRPLQSVEVLLGVLDEKLSHSHPRHKSTPTCTTKPASQVHVIP